MFFRVYYNQRSEIQEEHRRDLEVIRMLTKQQKHEQDMQRIREFRLFDDDFLKKCFEDHDECAELVLRIIMNKEDLKVLHSKTEYVIQNLQGRSVRLDVKATDSENKEYDIEVQRADKGMTGAIAKAEELKKEIEGSMIAGQFVNPANPEAHRRTTGPEIWNDTDGEVDAFVAGVGTGGTITGVGEYLKSKNDKIEIIAVEPATSPVLSQGKPGPHKIQGIGAGFVPEILNTKIYDSVVPVENDDAFEYAKLISHTEGILVGISAGAALYAAIEWAKKPENEGKTIVALLPDSGDRYYSTSLFEN